MFYIGRTVASNLFSRCCGSWRFPLFGETLVSQSLETIQFPQEDNANLFRRPGGREAGTGEKRQKSDVVVSCWARRGHFESQADLPGIAASDRASPARRFGRSVTGGTSPMLWASGPHYGVVVAR